MWARLPNKLSAVAFSQFAIRYGVQVATCASFTIEESDYGHIRLPYTAPEPVLHEGMRRLGQAWAAYDTTTTAQAII